MISLTNHLLGIISGVFLMVSGFLLGTTAVGIQADPPQRQQHIFGTVLERSGRTARVRTPSGNVFIRMANTPPSVGSEITAWVKPRQPRPVLPGAWNPNTTNQRFKASPLTAIRWAPIGEIPQRSSISHHHPFGGVLLALTTGERSRIDDDLKQLMRRTGTVHLLSISGLHVGMIAAFGAGLSWILTRPLVLFGRPRLARFLIFVGSTGAACSYGQLVGWPVSTQRAAWMVAAVGLSTLFERRPHAWQFLGIAALAVILNEPAQAGSLSFMLSFGAVAGLIGWVPFLTSWIPPDAPRMVRWIASSLGATTAAMMGTAPVSLWVFQEISLSSPLANLVVVPIFAGLVVPAALMGVHLPQEGRDVLLAIAASGIDVAYQWLKICDWGTIYPAIGPFGALLLGTAVLLYSRPKWALCLAVLSFVRSPQFTSHLEIIFPDVGQGSSALISWPNGTRWLIDGGPSSHSLLHWLRRKGIRKIDTVFLTHPDNDHLGGLIPIVNAMSVDHLWSPRRPLPTEKHFHDFWLRAAQQDVKLHLSTEGHPNILYPPPDWNHGDVKEDNDMSLVLLVEHGKHRFLFTGDISRKVENQLMETVQQATLVQVPHHGSISSSSMNFVNKTQPLIALIQAGKANRFGHPHPTIVHRWNPKKVLRTDKYGSIRIRSDGDQLHADHWTPKTGWASVTKQFSHRR